MDYSLLVRRYITINERMWDVHSYTFAGVDVDGAGLISIFAGVKARESGTRCMTLTTTESSLELTCIFLTRVLDDLQSTDIRLG